MSGTGRGDLVSSNLDSAASGPAYTSGHRSSYSGSAMERSSSFREGSEGRTFGSGTIGRGAASPSEMPSLAPYLLPVDSVYMVEQKSFRLGELRRVLGNVVDEHSYGGSISKALPQIPLEEVKHLRTSMQESCARGRDKVKLLKDSMLKLDKYRNMISRKRQRSDSSNEKFSSSSFSKAGAHTNQSPSELVSQRAEDWPRNVVTNKRARSSLTEPQFEGRVSNSVRHDLAMEKEKPSFFDKDKLIMRTSNEGSLLSEDKLRGLNPGGEGWEKKLKRKRSVGTMLNRGNDADRELKPTIQQRATNDLHPRLSDSFGFRPGASGSMGGTSKANGSSPQRNAGSRILLKTEMDAGPISNEKKERTSGSGLDRERIQAKVNKQNARDDPQPGSQLLKGKASRPPRNSSFSTANTSANFSRFSGAFDGGEPASSMKVQPFSSMANRRRNMPTGSPTPVTQWGGQRPQKMSRSRRANVVSPVSNFDEPSDGSVAADITARTSPANVSGNSLHAKFLAENVPSPAGFSESEESGATNKKEKVTNNHDTEDGSVTTVQKATSLSFPIKKNKVLLKEDASDGMRRQGRSARGCAPAKSGLPVMNEKLENVDTFKPIKSGRPGHDKTERLGRPPLKKSSDRKAYSRPTQVVHSSPSDLAGESDDDREELLEAANTAYNASCDACSSSFWKKMQLFFSYATDEDISFLKNQIALTEELDKSASDLLDSDYADTFSSRFMSLSRSVLPTEQSNANGVEQGKHMGNSISSDDTRISKRACVREESDKWFGNVIPLSQRLLSALIVEDGNDSVDYSMELEESKRIHQNSMNSVLANGHTDAICISSSNIQSFYPHASEFTQATLDDRLLMELHSIDLFPDVVPELDEGEGEVDKAILELKARLEQQVKEKNAHLHKLVQSVQDAKQKEEMDVERLAMDKLVEIAHKRLFSGRSSSHHKNSTNKASRQLAAAFAKRTLTKCRKFEETGRSCFSESAFRDILYAPRPRPVDDLDGERTVHGHPFSASRADSYDSFSHLAEHKHDSVSNKAGVKWKRTDRVRDQNKDSSNKGSHAKSGRPALTSGRGDRKMKSKPKHKFTQLSGNNGGLVSSPEAGPSLLTKRESHPFTSSSKPSQAPKNESLLSDHQLAKELDEPMFPNLPLSGIGVNGDLDMGVGLGSQGEDISSWLNFDDEPLQGDLVGLEIPMDDITELNLT